MEQNNWIRMNTQNLLSIKKLLTECEYLPEYDRFPLRKIQLLLNGSEAEIMRLVNEVAGLKLELKKAQEVLKKE